MRRRALQVFLHWKISQQRETLWAPPSSVAYEPGEATTCALSVTYGLGVTRRPSGACSAIASCTYGRSDHLAKLAGTRRERSFDPSAPTRRPCAVLGGEMPCPRCKTSPPATRLARCSRARPKHQGVSPARVSTLTPPSDARGVRSQRGDHARAERCLWVWHD